MKLRLGAGYGAAETGIAAAEVMLQLYLLNFYIGQGLSPFLTGLALACAVALDAFADPLVGGISDRARPEMGRRRAFILGGSIFLSIAMPALFHPPSTGEAGLFAYLLISYLGVNLAMTLLSVPHSAMAGELVPDPSERTALFGFRLLFNCVGLLAGIISPSLSGSSGHGSIVIGVIALVSALITFRATRGLDILPAKPESNVPRQPMLNVMRSTLSNRSFLLLVLAFLIASVGRTFNSSLALYYYKYRLLLSEEQTTRVVLGLFVLVVTVSIVAWVLLARRYGKKRPAFAGILGLGLLTAIGYPLYPPGQLGGPILAAVLGGFFVASIILFESLVADMAEAERVRSGEAREGIFFGFWKMANKAARALGLALSGVALSGIGFSNTVTPGPEIAWKIALLFGPGVGACFIAAAVIFLGVQEPEKPVQNPV